MLFAIIGDAWSVFSNSITQTQKSDNPGIIHMVRYGPREILGIQQIGETDPKSKYFCVDKGQNVNEKIYSKFHEYLFGIVNPSQVPRLEPQPTL